MEDNHGCDASSADPQIYSKLLAKISEPAVLMPNIEQAAQYSAGFPVEPWVTECAYHAQYSEVQPAG
jgi:hypothetical protein